MVLKGVQSKGILYIYMLLTHTIRMRLLKRQHDGDRSSGYSHLISHPKFLWPVKIEFVNANYAVHIKEFIALKIDNQFIYFFILSQIPSLTPLN